MTDRDALYAAILAAPDDDTPRLVYADYLDDTGVRMNAIRARFIRNQIALARTDQWSDEADRLRRAIGPVWSHYGKTWASPNLDGVSSSGFARGFVESVSCESEWFWSHGESAVRSHPLRGAYFADLFDQSARPALVRLLNCPHLARLRAFDFAGEAADDSFAERFASWPAASGCEQLHLDYTMVGARGLSALLSGRLEALVDLSFGFHDDLQDGQDLDLVDVVVRGSGTAGLRRLSLGKVRMAATAARMTAGSPRLAGLSELSMGSVSEFLAEPLDSGGVVALAESPYLKNLLSLDLGFLRLNDAGVIALAESYRWPNLKYLSLRSSDITAAAIPALAANPHLRSLRVIDLQTLSLPVNDTEPLQRALPHTRIIADGSPWQPPPTELAPEDRP